jgi:hypothetical protein
MERTPLPVLAF